MSRSRYGPSSSNRQTVQPSPEFIDEVSRLKSVQDTEELKSIIYRTQDQNKVSVAAAALSEIGTEEAKNALLSPIAANISKSELLWPFVIGSLTENDAETLLEIEKNSTRNPRMAAKHKLPPEARDILMTYLETNVGVMPWATLRQFVHSRYRDLSARAFELLLVNDSPATRQVLRETIHSSADMRKADRRAVLAYEELLRRLPEKEHKKLLAEASETRNTEVSSRAAKVLSEKHPRYYIGMIKKKFCLQSNDIRALSIDGKPDSIARIIEEEKGLVLHNYTRPDKMLKAKVRSLAIALAAQETPEASKALLSLLRKLDSAGEMYCDEILMLCRILTERGERKAIPTLKIVAGNLEVATQFAAARAILDIEGVSPNDKKNPLAVKARKALVRQEEMYEEEHERITDSRYLVSEDLDIKSMDRGALTLWKQDIYLSKSLFYKS